MIEPFTSFRLYQSIKLHFDSDSYDCIKYHFKTSTKPETFWKRKDKYFFAKIGKQFDDTDDLIGYYASQFVADNKWIGDMINDEAVFKDWQRRTQSLAYNFEQDICKLESTAGSFDKLFDCSNGHPVVITSLISEEISIETVVILNHITKFLSKADKEITETIVWPDISRKIRKYGSFINIDNNKFKNIILKVFSS
ncbi:MAG: hypothetical protein HOK52_14970 [Candidatus Marinimicrobia bacterium]|jgi:hypothetical protein|nr:hypothetical protein [Candidatus Neomarinimicrobiota bacterium]